MTNREKAYAAAAGVIEYLNKKYKHTDYSRHPLYTASVDLWDYLLYPDTTVEWKETRY